MQETETNLITTHEENVKAMVVIDWKAKWIRIECPSWDRKVDVFDFATHEVAEQTQIITFYFNSKELKVAALFVKDMLLTIQFKDGRLENFSLTKQLW